MSTDSSLSPKQNFDPNYELDRVTSEAQFLKKMRLKRRLYRLVGELYVGRRVKFVYFVDG